MLSEWMTKKGKENCKRAEMADFNKRGSHEGPCSLTP